MAGSLRQDLGLPAEAYQSRRLAKARPEPDLR